MRSVDTLFWLQKMLFWVLRYPAYTVDFIKQEIETQAAQIPEDELARYSEFSTSKRHFMAELMIIYTIINSKNLYFVYYTMTNVDFINHGANIKPLGAGDEFGFTCLASNCPKYIETASNTTVSLASELIKLPVFALCQRELKWYYNPNLAAHKMALILDSGFSFLASATCIMVQVYIYSNPPQSNVSALFCTCPMAELNRIKRRIGLTLERLSFSLNNFIRIQASEVYKREIAYSRISYDQIEADSYWMAEESPINRSRGKNLSRIEANPFQFNEVEDNKDKFKENSDDYLPINRTQWWRQKWAGSMAAICPIVVVCNWLMHCVTHAIFAYLAQHVSSKEQSDFLDLVKRANCSIWYNDDNHRDLNGTAVGRHLTFEHIENQWNWFTISELLLLPIVPVYIIVITICNYHYACMDIKVCIVELKILLDLAVDYIELNNFRAIKTRCNDDWANFKCNQEQSPLIYLNDLNIHESRAKSKTHQMNELKLTVANEISWLTSIITQRSIKMINFDLPFILLITPFDKSGRLIKGKLGARLENQEFALDLLKLSSGANYKKVDHSTTELFVKLLEKIHVNYLTLVGLLNEHQPGLKLILLTSYFCNYGFSLMGVYFYRNFDDFRRAPLVYILLLWITVSFFISIASSIQADSKKLYHVFWSIVACTANCHDVRIKHFRLIWYKNLMQVGTGGGLAVRIWNISITYVRILHLTLGTATIFALSLNRN